MVDTKTTLLLTLLLLAGCRHGSAESCYGAAPYADPGPHEVGVRTISVGDVSAEVWYPAKPGATAGRQTDAYDVRNELPLAERTKIPDDAQTTFDAGAFRDVPVDTSRRFPVIVFSHGFGGFRTQSSFLTAHLASWGYVVAAPDHPSRSLSAVLTGAIGQDSGATALVATLDALSAANEIEGDPFFAALDVERAVLTGHSAGSLSVAGAGSDPRVVGWAIFAGFASPADATKPGLVLGGTADDIAQPATVEGAFAAAPQTDKRLVMLKRAGHLAFADLCEIGKDEGGLLALAERYGVSGVSPVLVALGSDGCGDDELPATRAWPLIRHETVAFARRLLDGDPVTRDERAAADACFAEIVSSKK